MIVSIARQSVIIKCNMQASILLGNYEFYYAAGLFCKLNQISVEADIQPKALKAALAAKAEAFQKEDEKEKYLAWLLKQYKPEEAYDASMRTLLQMGLEETHLWQVNID